MRFAARLLKVLFLLILIVVAAIAFLFLVPYGPHTEQFVDIAPGTSTLQMGRQLKQAGVLRTGYELQVLRFTRGGSLKAGEYRFDHPATPAEVYDRLHRGDVYTIALTIPEGYNIFDIAGAVQAAGLDSSASFLAAERAHTELIRAWRPPGSPQPTSLEGFLFPDTYKFNHHSTEVEMLGAMVKRFAEVATRLRLQPADAPRVVTMASLIEREVRVPSERPVVAGVFENRLRAGMPLQTDPSVIYASLLNGTWTGVIHQSELHSDSPYNTYTHPGLPPGPICNPGVASLQAALRPAQTDYMYFVANPDGSSKFAKQLDEHNANVAQYRQQSAQPQK
ncbi:MAG TPA: endolytic transglycosylase MltG [Acidobacteriaceae bacterium]|nr:endolytic transglycosylase MltG [Acidobacteriaceae bacterium]